MSLQKNNDGDKFADKSQSSVSNDVLRVALDKDAALAYERMSEALKEESFVKLTPSKFVSFLTNLFFLKYFEKDKRLIL